MSKRLCAKLKSTASFAAAIDDYLGHGGSIKRCDENEVTVDWANGTRFRHAARQASLAGHRKRLRQKGSA